MRHRRRNVAQQNQYINSDFINFQLSIFILLLVLFGGSGSLYGPLIGAVLLTLIDAMLARWPVIQHFAYGGLLLFALYAMPNGVAGVFGRFLTRKSADEAGSAGKQPAVTLAARGIDRSRSLLEVASLSKNFGGVRPANDVTFQLQSGHVHALIGPKIGR